MKGEGGEVGREGGVRWWATVPWGGAMGEPVLDLDQGGRTSSFIGTIKHCNGRRTKAKPPFSTVMATDYHLSRKPRRHNTMAPAFQDRRPILQGSMPTHHRHFFWPTPARGPRMEEA